MDPTLHEQMECHNKEVAHVLQTKMEAVLTAFAVPVESALDAHTLAKGSKRSRRREAIQEARKIIQNTQRKVAAISQQSDAISRKRKETMQQMKENKISFYSSLQQLIQHYNNFRHLQNLLGRKEVPALSSEAICDMTNKATKLDDAIRPLSTLPTPMAANQDREEKEERRLVVPNLSPLWTYHTADRKWQYGGFFQFKAARKNLQYYQAAKREEEEKYDPAVLLRAYLPKTAPKAQRPLESAFDYQIRIRYDVAATLKNTMVYPVSFNKVLARNHGRAARLVLCKEMLAVFEHTVNNELLSKAAIQKMSNQLAAHFKAQKEIFNGPFNAALKQLQFNLALSTQHAILGHSNLAQIDAWIESGVKKTRLEEDLAEIEAQATRLNCLQEYPLLKIKTRQKLNAYIANDSMIAQQLQKIQREIGDHRSLGEIAALSKPLVSLKSILQAEKYSALTTISAEIDLLKNIDSALGKCDKIAALRLKQALLDCVPYTLKMLEEIKISPSEDPNRQNVMKELESLAALLQSPSENYNRDRIIQALTKAAHFVSCQCDIPNRSESLILRIAINHIALKIGHTITPEEFGKLLSLKEKAPSLSAMAVANTFQKAEAGTTGYEIKRFVLSKFGFGLEEKITIAGEDFTTDEFFNDVLQPLHKIIKKDNHLYNAMKKRIVALLNATSMQEEDVSKMALEADQILNCLRVNDVSGQHQKTRLSDLCNALLLLPPFNTTLQRLKRSVERYRTSPEPSTHAAGLKEPEAAEIREQANTMSKAIQSKIKKYIQFIQSKSSKNPNDFFNKAYTIIVAENEKHHPQLIYMEQKIDQIIDKQYYKNTPEIINLLHIYIASETYSKNPCQYTRDDLLFTVETVINVALDSGKSEMRLKDYFKTLQTILFQLTTHDEDRAYLFNLSNQLNKLVESQKQETQTLYKRTI
jgi:hypothetical protein